MPAKYAMVVPSTKLIVLNPVIMTDQKIDTEGRINIRRDCGAALTLCCFACAHLKVDVKNSAQLILSWLPRLSSSSVCPRDEENGSKKAQPRNRGENVEDWRLVAISRGVFD